MQSGEDLSENLTNKLIEELTDPTIFVRSCILRGSKHVSKCIENFEISTKYVNEQLEKQIVELGQISTIQRMCNDIIKLEECSKTIGEYFSKYKNSIGIDTIPIIQKYDSIKDNMLISKRILQIQNLCNRTIEFISLISKLKIQFGIKKKPDNEEQYNTFFMQFQNGIPDSVDIFKTSKIIVELESMIYFKEENVIESENNEKKVNNSIVSSLEFLEVLQEDIKWLRKLSAIYRQNGHKKLLKGIEEMDSAAIYSSCIILDQFGELWEHIDIIVEDVILKRLNHTFQVSNLQKCIETTDKMDQVLAVSIEYATFSILKVIENALNQVIFGLKQLICIYDTLVENKINSQGMNQMNFVNLFWEKSLLFFESVFNNIYSINSKNPNIHQISFGKEIIINMSLKLEQLFHLLINCYPDISNMFNMATKNIKALISSSSSKVIANTIVNGKNILNSISKIRETYLFSIKDRFSKLFESIIPKKSILSDSYEKLSSRISDIIQEIIKEIQRASSCNEISHQVYDIFKNELLCFMVTCETIIQPEGGIITYLEKTEDQSNPNFAIEITNTSLKKRLPLPTKSHNVNANISIIAAILSSEIKKIYEIEFINNIDMVGRDRMIELLKSLQYKSSGKWFSQTSSAILELIISYYDKKKTSSMFESDKSKIGENFLTLSQEIVTNFFHNWAPLLYNHDYWSKCYVLLCRNIIIIVLVNFTLKSELDEESCFEIAEEIVSLQSIVSNFISDQTIKNLLLNDVKMIQDFRRILFSDIKSIREAIDFSGNTKDKESNNSEIIWRSIYDLDNLLFTVHILNRIFYILNKSNNFLLKTFVEHSRISDSQLSRILGYLLFIKFNKCPTCESDTDLFIIFNIFKQNASSEYINDPELLPSKIRNYIDMIEKELELHRSSVDYSGLIDDLEVIIKFIKENYYQSLSCRSHCSN
ncbi:uncharacterized protein cubi_01780 [Cryptosporidium ubiquitum]|uniref:Uncharacterized protein n=1 Tax=Cryptosporidium ubiquitum TaxID=857276 RepID=A0A1J4MAQ2_9CRYT|nr:uncharacterized protein cubi_01780 [Cryptosporidium ubiquitum]OII71305.1 hypothetical protein cubi_01780 [Cryptosporidium ubiquitum]